MVIACLGQRLSLGLSAGFGLDRRGHIQVDGRTMQTTLDRVFAGGDAVNPSTVIEAVAQGRRAAMAIDRALGHDGRLFDEARAPVAVAYDEEAYLKTLPRREPRHAEVEARVRSLAREVSLGLTLEAAVEEARRCLHCDRNQPVVEKNEAESPLHIEQML
jgi:NADPH-dependent glutamate synthase beta subunit-like oxidoreductase